MPRPLQPLHQRRTDQAIGTGDENGRSRPWRAAFIRALCSGTSASLCSTALVSWLGRRRSGHVPAGTNATSQWLWGSKAHRRDRWSLRYTLTGFVIHHCSSLFWACGFERAKGARATTPGRVLALAAATTAVAYLVDYKVVPQRLSPGFDQRLRRSDLFCVYVGFGLGLALPWLLARRDARPPARLSAPAGRPHRPSAACRPPRESAAPAETR